MLQPICRMTYIGNCPVLTLPAGMSGRLKRKRRLFWQQTYQRVAKF